MKKDVVQGLEATMGGGPTPTERASDAVATSSVAMNVTGLSEIDQRMPVLLRRSGSFAPAPICQHRSVGPSEFELSKPSGRPDAFVSGHACSSVRADVAARRASPERAAR